MGRKKKDVEEPAQGSSVPTQKTGGDKPPPVNDKQSQIAQVEPAESKKKNRKRSYDGMSKRDMYEQIKSSEKSKTEAVYSAEAMTQVSKVVLQAAESVSSLPFSRVSKESTEGLGNSIKICLDSYTPEIAGKWTPLVALALSIGSLSLEAFALRTEEQKKKPKTISRDHLEERHPEPPTEDDDLERLNRA